MNKHSQKRSRKIKKLVLVTVLCAVLLGVSTYAWFIGMKKVNVTSFDIKIATTESLQLSLNGTAFAQDIAISETTYNVETDTTNPQNAVYAGHTNSWGDLVPVSTVGVIDTTASRLTMYEKGSLTTSPGGYRIMASEVTNKGAAEAKGYVAFDLFVKNLSGEEYYVENNQLNEEAIYLNIDSKVEGSGTTTGAENSGIENSIRVAFAQIGRVEATTTTASTITGISCSTAGEVTGICRNATIWEPNDTKHVQNAINWYDTSCASRTGADITAAASYGAFGSCAEVTTTGAVPTYAVAQEIDYTDQVDAYDGAALNGYTGSTTSGHLQAMDYFTDTERDLSGTARPTFMTLAPNSITKVRVYIYLEGQDIDNYDFASLGEKITMNFGFTKERFFGEDIGYTGTPTLPDDVVEAEQNP